MALALQRMRDRDAVDPFTSAEPCTCGPPGPGRGIREEDRRKRDDLHDLRRALADLLGAAEKALRQTECGHPDHAAAMEWIGGVLRPAIADARAALGEG